MSSSSSNAYDILEVDATCSTDDLKASYKRLILMHHPDKSSQTGENHTGEAFNRILAAWKLVSTPEDRKKYDMTANSGVYGSTESCTISEFQASSDGSKMSKACRCGDYYEVSGGDCCDRDGG